MNICSKNSLTTSVLSTLMTYVKNISNWPDPGGQIMDMSHNYFKFLSDKGHFPGKTRKQQKHTNMLKMYSK